MIKNIVFDFGGVLVQYDFVTFFANILGSREEGEWFMENVLPHSVNNEMDLEFHNFRYYIEQQQRLWPDYAEALDIDGSSDKSVDTYASIIVARRL